MLGMAADGLAQRVSSGFGQALDPLVLQRARRRDAAAQEAIYRLYSRACYNLALRILGNPAAAEDIVQDVFVRMLDALPGFRGEAPFGAWLKRMTTNATIDVARRNRRLDTDSAEVLLERTAVEQPGPDVGVYAWSLLMRLSVRERAVVILHELEGYTHKELASLFGQSESYSKSVLARALKRLGVQDGGANEWRGDA